MKQQEAGPWKGGMLADESEWPWHGLCSEYLADDTIRVCSGNVRFCLRISDLDLLLI